MRSLNAKQITLLTMPSVLTALMLVLILPFIVWSQGTSQEDGSISGRYAGTVAISAPVALGLLDLAFEVDNVNGVLTGTISVTQTQVFLASPVLHGSITSNPDAITPTFRLDSEVFGGVVSGREVARSFALVGEALDEGYVLRGQYEETIAGFTPQPMVVTGTFLVVRPSRALTVSVVAPVPTPVPEPPDHFIYLPVVLR